MKSDAAIRALTLIIVESLEKYVKSGKTRTAILQYIQDRMWEEVKK
jgi:hypothetical protein